MDVSFIIVNWNSSKFLEECLRSIEKFVQRVKVEAIIVDNYSKAEEIKYLKEKLEPTFPWAKFIYSAENLGFARANNLACKSATGKFVLLLNPDTCFIQEGFEELVDKAAAGDSGMVSCKLLNEDRSIQLSCFYFPTLWRVIGTSLLLHKLLPGKLKQRFTFTGKDHEQRQNPDWVLGAFMLLPRKVFEQVDGFDEAIFMYGEDMDLCYKVRQLGLNIAFHPEFSLIHYGGASGKQAWSNAKRETMVYRAIFYFYRKYFGKLKLILARGAFALGALIRLLAIALVSIRPGRLPRGLNEMKTQWFVLLTCIGRQEG